MKPWRPILQAARTRLIALALGLLIALALSSGSDYFNRQWQQELQQQRQQLAALRAQLNEKTQETAYLDGHVSDFQRLQKNHLLDAPRREVLVEQLLAAHLALNLPNTLTYTIPPPRPMVTATDAAAQPSAEPSPPADTAMPLMHDVEIKLGSIHETELLALLEKFRTTTHDRFRVQNCLLDNPTPTGLTATCTLRTFTLPLPAAHES